VSERGRVASIIGCHGPLFFSEKIFCIYLTNFVILELINAVTQKSG
jgi:hypothetical protein